METLNLNQTVVKSIQDFYQKNDFGEDGRINKNLLGLSLAFSLFQFRTLKVEKTMYIFTIYTK